MKIITVAAIWGILQLQQLFIECVPGEQDTSQQQQQHQHHYHRVLRRNKQGLPAIVVGRLGHVKRRMANTIDNHDNHDDMNNDEEFRTGLQTEVLTILREKFGSLGHEDLRIKGRVRKSRDGSFHVRLQELINGLPVEGTGLSVHFSTNGTIYAMNGEHLDGSQAALTATIHGDTACGLALLAANVSVAGIVQQSPPELTNVMDFDGRVRLAWKCQVEYHATDFLGQRSFRRDIIYGDAQDGSLCAIHPKVYGFRSSRGRSSSSSSTSESTATGADVQTFTCVPANTAAPDPFQKTCTLYSDSTNVIDTGHGPLDSAHNYALATFKYYMENHDLWSIDGQGMPLLSYVLNQAFNVDNAFWSSDSMTYGDGHQWFLPMSMDAGVVGHEFTHGVTEHSSGLIYYGESGALNEAWSDIFGVLIDRQEGARGHNIWILGEKISQSGEGLRDMSDPASKGHYDYYPTRYIGTDDSGGVHWNSGVANLAFKLLVTGGSHPRSKSSVVVRGLIEILGNEDLAFKTAGDIFFCANDDCLTSGATFEDARHCTATICGSMGLQEDSDIVRSIHTAWFAVGVGDDPSLTSAPTSRPTHAPTDKPTPLPSFRPTPKPTDAPTSVPSDQPTLPRPSSRPSSLPTAPPTSPPSWLPTNGPTLSPSIAPSSQPTSLPTDRPTPAPSSQPSSSPTNFPTSTPSSSPTMVPSGFPSSSPSSAPSFAPSPSPVTSPSNSPSSYPSQTPTTTPSSPPNTAPSQAPSVSLSSSPSRVPSSNPTSPPTISPSSAPSDVPSSSPSSESSVEPSDAPSAVPSDMPSLSPSKQSMQPSGIPSALTSDTPSSSPSKTSAEPPDVLYDSIPSNIPSKAPSFHGPSEASSKSPIAAPSVSSRTAPPNLNQTTLRMPTVVPADLPPTFGSIRVQRAGLPNEASEKRSKLPTISPTPTIGFDASEKTLSPTTLGPLSNGHTIGNPTIASISAPSESPNQSPVSGKTTLSLSISTVDTTATLPPIDPNILPEPCLHVNSTCAGGKATSSPTGPPALNVSVAPPSTSPTLGSSRLNVHEAAINSNEFNGVDNVTHDGNEKDPFHASEPNDSVPIDEQKHTASDELYVGSNVIAEELSKISQAAGASQQASTKGNVSDSHYSSISDETATTGASHQTSTLDYSIDRDNEKTRNLIVVSTAMGALAMLAALIGVALYRTMKPMDDHSAPKFKGGFAQLV